MYCINPIYVEGRGIFPCGMCRFCRVMRSNLWAMRMVHERQYWKEACFVTLTYNDNHLPVGGALVKKDLQDFIKRLRKAMAPRRCKYFACGEYGEKYGRPHFHIIFFGVGLSVADRRLVDKEWAQGFIKVESFSRKSARYVTKYVTKAALGKSKKRWENDNAKPAPFQCCSRGIGLSWLMENIKSLGERGLLYHGKAITMPRYYADKGRLAGMSTQFLEDVKADRMQESIESYRRWFEQGMSAEEVRTMHEDLNKQRVEELKTMDSMRRLDKEVE